MRKLVAYLAAGTLSTVLAFAQASGNFNASGTNAACAIGTNGDFNGGAGPLSVLTTYVKTSNGSGVTLLIRPSLVTGLYTNTKIDTTLNSASADTGIQVCVTVDGSSDNVFPKDASGQNACVIYDQRFQQVSSNLFSQLSECTSLPTGTPCGADSDCSSLGTGFTCSIPTGGTTGVCVGPNPDCNFDLILSTLAAHSYDFVAQVPGDSRPHTIRASWSTIGAGPSSRVNSCVGPGVLTVTQTKIFHQNGSLDFSNP